MSYFSYNLATNLMHMNTGDGETSYAKNSGLQKAVILRTLPVLNDTLEELLDDPHLGSQKCYKIVDFGCSSGLNSIWSMTHVTDMIENMCKKKEPGVVPEFVGYLNDLPENDFNNLFKFLPDSHGNDQNGNVKGRRFMYGVPGSFYERLFPENTLHFAYSSYSLHWLSQVPEGLESNKENIYLAEKSSTKVFEAYSNQFQQDFSTFLRFRGEEMIQGGRMVLTFMGRSVENVYAYDDSAQLTLLAKSFVDMVTEGLVKREDLYSFNIPHYAPSKSEVNSILEKEGSFTSERIEDFSVPWCANDNINDEQEDQLIDNHKSATLVAGTTRAFMEPMITKHFGSSISIDGLFDRYTRKVADYMSFNEATHFTLVISLSRR